MQAIPVLSLMLWRLSLIHIYLEKIRKLTEGVEGDLRKNDRHVLSLKALKDLDEIEKIARRVRNRMRRY